MSKAPLNLIVDCDGDIVFDFQQRNNQQICDSVRDIKRAIEASHNISVQSQLLSLENILLPESIRIEDLAFKHNSTGSDSNGTRSLNRPIKLTLTRLKGQVSLKVNIISNKRDPIALNLVVHGSISVFLLRETILGKLSADLKGKSDAEIVLSIKKKQLEDDKYLFETLYELFNAESEEEQQNNRN